MVEFKIMETYDKKPKMIPLNNSLKLKTKR